MINRLHSLLFRPERGWDPITFQYGKQFADDTWASYDSGLIDKIEKKIGSLEDKKILDLGAGPGHWTYEFAKRGAYVTWYDVSRFYMEYAKKIHSSLDLNNIEYVIGYLEDSTKLNRQFDLVFNNICFYYSMDDYILASIICNQIKSGGIGYIATAHIGWIKEWTTSLRIKVWLNERFNFKIGHPMCSEKKMMKVFERCEYENIEYDVTETGITIWVYK